MMIINSSTHQKDKLKSLANTKILSIGVHNGQMHADDVFAVASISYIHPEYTVVRTRDPEELERCDIRIDVGDKYNHHTRDYDHHMSWFDVRHTTPRSKLQPDGTYKEYARGPLRSGLGLVWLHYGADIVKEVISLNLSSLDGKYKTIDFIQIQQKMDEGIISYIDAIDNGEGEEFNLKNSPFRVTDISQLIANFNIPSIQQERMTAEEINLAQHNAFMDAVEFAAHILEKEILDHAAAIYYREKFLENLDKMPEDGDGLYIMDVFRPWAYGYGRANEATNKVNMIIYPVTTGWMCQTPYYYSRRDGKRWPPTLSDGSKRRYKHQAPENICGLRDEELQNVTGIPDATFVHKGGHLGAAKTKEGAIALAKYFIAHARS